MDDEQIAEQIRSEFLNEARELSEIIEKNLLALEDSPKDETLHAKIFRQAHTIKGSAFAAGFASLAEFAHNMEALLGLVRSHEITATPDVIDMLLAANDIIHKHLDELDDDHQTELSYTATHERLSHYLSQHHKPDHTATATTAPTSGLHLFEDEPETPEIETSTPDTSQLTHAQDIQILVIDDEEDIREVLCDMTSSAFSNTAIIDEAANGIEAMSAIRDNTYDLILTDLNMPSMTGLQLIEQIRATDSETPIVVVSGHADREALAACIHAGVSDFIEKPFHLESIQTTVRRAVQLHEARKKAILLINQSFQTFMLMHRYQNLLGNVAHPPEAQSVLDELKERFKEMKQLTHDLLS